MTKHVAPEKRAKIFWSGRSQAVRLPKEFRFDADEVQIRREGDRVVLEPVPAQDGEVDFEKEWGWLKELTPPDDAFIAAVNEPVPLPEGPTDAEEFFN